MTEHTGELTADDVAFAGIQFINALTRFYGVDQGMAVWNMISSAVSTEIKGKIFFSMLGNGQTKIIFSAADAVSKGNAVAVIKAIRAHTDFGLRESKQLWDQSIIAPTVIVVDPSYRNILVYSLRELGCTVT